MIGLSGFVLISTTGETYEKNSDFNDLEIIEVGKVYYIKTSDNIEIKMPQNLYITSLTNASKPAIKRTLKKTNVKVIKTINNFEEFDASIFGT